MVESQHGAADRVCAGPQVWNNEGVILIPDHYIFTDDPRANRNVDLLRGYAHKYNIKYFYDITDRSDFQANPDYKGVCHVALAQEGHAIPGEVLFGTDSHTCNAGAFGQFASGIGNTDAGFILGTGKLLIKVCVRRYYRRLASQRACAAPVGC